ncbi:MAG: outer membrane beta-barrel protein [Alteromonadaceae bacterium]|nr:outer membrane beta-barrel protein [Alteromonadaceae bacterium]
MLYTKRAILCGLLMPVVCTAANFDEDEFEDQSIPVGGYLITPIVKFQQRFDTNVISAKTGEIDSWVTIFQSAVKVTREFGEFGKHNFELDWVFTHGAYHASGEDSYNDHDVSGKLNYEINQRHRLMFQGGYIDSHEERGSRFSIGRGGDLIEPDTFEQIFGAVQYTFGSETSDARLEIEAGYLDNDYRTVLGTNVNSGDIEDNTATRDRKTTEFGGTFYYKVGDATDLTLEAWQTDVNYDYTRNPLEELSSAENRILVGAIWEATAFTKGFAKIGYKDKDFDLDGRDSFNGFEWEAEVEWEPKTYSRFTFSTSRATHETNGEGYFDLETGEVEKAHLINNTQYSVQWQHEWRDRVRTKFIYATSNDIYTGDEGQVREDNNKGINATLYYDMNYWLSFSLEYINNDRESTRDHLLYDRELITLGVRMALK